jgi:hypothetical protein
METFVSKPESTITIILFFFAALFVLAWVVIEVGKNNMKKERQRKLFNERYNKLQPKVEYWDVDHNHYCTLLLMIGALKKLPYQDREKVDVLETTFKRRYKPINDEILLQAESSAKPVYQKA